MECFRINKIQGDANKTSLKEGEGIEIEIYSASFAFVLRVLTVGKEQQLHLQHEGIHFPHESVQQILPIVRVFQICSRDMLMRNHNNMSWSQSNYLCSW